MNIKDAKLQIKNTLKAYLKRDEFGNYEIPPVRQRPILLIGPPGIGKTQIMEQIASEENVGLVAYTITHHTRQSAIGLPVVEKKVYDGREYTVTEYTMSEIIGSVYALMENTGIREGILFLDEINCVSETMAPMMLQFLQCKTFGNQMLPEGWLIVGAGNPPEYNKSVRDFDVVTLDRVKRINVTEDFNVWKEYALNKGLHGAVVSYLDIKKDNFYRIETGAEGMEFATARGWEDLSEIIYTYEKLDIPVDVEVIEQYIQFPAVARDFANYLTLYNKYNREYHIDEILSGKWHKVTESEFKNARFDEKLAVINLLYSRISEECRNTRIQSDLTDRLYDDVAGIKEESKENDIEKLLIDLSEKKRDALRIMRDAGQNDKNDILIRQKEIAGLERFLEKVRNDGSSDKMEILKALFFEEKDRRLNMASATDEKMNNAFSFLESSSGKSQEMVFFVTDLTSGYDTSWYIEEFGNDAYFRNNDDLLIDDRRKSIIDKILN